MRKFALGIKSRWAKGLSFKETEGDMTGEAGAERAHRPLLHVVAGEQSGQVSDDGQSARLDKLRLLLESERSLVL